MSASFRPIGFRYELRRVGDPDEEEWDRLYGPDVHAIPEEVYVAEVSRAVDPVLAPDEHTGFRWCTFDAALELLTWDDNRRALVAARAFIAAGS